MTHGNENETYALDEALFLGANQNFFDQEPFKAAIEGLLTDSGVLGSVKYGEPRWRKDKNLFIRGEITAIATMLNSFASPEQEYDAIEKHVLAFNPRVSQVKVIERLRGYPVWYEYVTAMFQTHRTHREDGQPKQQMKGITKEGIPTYAYWLAQRLQQKTDPKLFGISQLFVETNIDRVSNRTRVRWESRRIIP